MSKNELERENERMNYVIIPILFKVVKFGMPAGIQYLVSFKVPFWANSQFLGGLQDMSLTPTGWGLEF